MSEKSEFVHRIEYLFTRIAALTVQILPLRAALWYGAFLGWTAWAIGVRKKVARLNIASAFPDMKAEEVNRTGRASYMNSGRSMAEFIRQRSLTREYFEKYITVEKTPALEKVLANEGGLIFLSGHFGNWESLGTLSYIMAKKIAIIVAKQHNVLIDKYINSLRSSLGVTILRRDASIRGVIDVAGRGGVLCWLGDQDAGRNGLVVNFFGLPASTARGAAAFAVKLNLPLAVGGMVREKGPYHKLVVRAFLEADPDLSRNEAELDLTQRHVTALEELISEYPEQYWWAHRRWKTTTDLYRKG
ncbi:hypothetical protein CSA37_00390 [Candidatus Fermentibacteria bacterium]|nr:MAG: hypothetical protein CSA37_00390 [Candidatus Fermentibacteria bacterium]